MSHPSSTLRCGPPLSSGETGDSQTSVTAATAHREKTKVWVVFLLPNLHRRVLPFPPPSFHFSYQSPQLSHGGTQSSNMGKYLCPPFLITSFDSNDLCPRKNGSGMFIPLIVPPVNCSLVYFPRSVLGCFVYAYLHYHHHHHHHHHQSPSTTYFLKVTQDKCPTNTDRKQPSVFFTQRGNRALGSEVENRPAGTAGSMPEPRGTGRLKEERAGRKDAKHQSFCR